MTRPVAQSHLSQLAELFAWMDQRPERRSLAPESRTPEGLWWEVLAGEEDKAWVSLSDGKIEGYAAMFPFWEGAALEGPVVREGDAKPLLIHLIRKAKSEGYPTLYAFPEAANSHARQLLESLGFAPQHTTYFFSIPPTNLAFPVPKGYAIRLDEPCDPRMYRDIFSRADEGWSMRLSWNDEELEEHFASGDVELFVAYQGDEPVGLAELEIGDYDAEIAYIGVVPEHRSKGLGRALLGVAAERAFSDPGVQFLRVRAHDHEKEAQKLYKRLGFEQKETVVTYALELEK